MNFLLSNFLSLGGRNKLQSMELKPEPLPSLSSPSKLLSHNTKMTKSSSLLIPQPKYNAASSAVSTKKRNQYAACQRFIGRPMTRAEALKKMESCARFRELVKLSTKYMSTTGKEDEYDVTMVDNAIGLEYGWRLRSCVERSKRTLYHHGNRTHY